MKAESFVQSRFVIFVAGTVLAVGAMLALGRGETQGGIVESVPRIQAPDQSTVPPTTTASTTTVAPTTTAAAATSTTTAAPTTTVATTTTTQAASSSDSAETTTTTTSTTTTTTVAPTENDSPDVLGLVEADTAEAQAGQPTMAG